MFRSYAAWKKVFVNNGNRTEWSPIPSVTIPMIDKIGRPRSESLICQSLVLLQIELDDMNSCYTYPKRKKKSEFDEIRDNNARPLRVLSIYIGMT